MRRFLQVVLCVGLFVAVPAAADEAEPPTAVADAAENAVAANDKESVASIAEGTTCDAWLVVDELLARSKPAVARAVADARTGRDAVALRRSLTARCVSRATHGRG